MGSGGAKAGGDSWPTPEECVRKMGKLLKVVKEDAISAGKEDPRKLIHSVKVGLALTLASLLYLLEPVFHGLGATLYKGINRGLGTVLAISMEFLIELFMHLVGHIGRAICIAIAVFTVALGSYRDSNMLHTAIQRLYTIGIGCVICLITSLLILPNWSGEELHSSIISKFEELAKMVQESMKKVPKRKKKNLDLNNNALNAVIMGYLHSTKPSSDLLPGPSRKIENC